MVGSLKIRILKLYEFVFFVCEIVLYSILKKSTYFCILALFDNFSQFENFGYAHFEI